MPEPSSTAAASTMPVGDKAASSPSVTPAKPRSRWRRYSLRALLLFQVVVAVFVWYVVSRVRSLQGQHAAMQEITAPNMPNHKERSAQPEWFWKPICRFCNCPSTDIVEIVVQHHPLKVSEIERLPYLEFLATGQGFENDQVMAIVADSTHLKVLQFTNNHELPISDEGPMQLRKNRSIERLRIQGKKFSDQAIAALSEMPKVTSLNLEHTSTGKEKGSGPFF